MDSLKFNKIFAGMLCAGLLIMIFSKLGDFLVSPVEIVQNAYPIKVENKDSIKKDVREDIVGGYGAQAQEQYLDLQRDIHGIQRDYQRELASILRFKPTYFVLFTADFLNIFLNSDSLNSSQPRSDFSLISCLGRNSLNEVS